MVATGMGAILGIFCILGVSQRMPANPLPNATIYLIGAWYNRVVMGIMIGFAGEFVLLPGEKTTLNSILRGALLGAIVSVGFAFFQQALTVTYFFAGIGFGTINDVVTTRITEE